MQHRDRTVIGRIHIIVAGGNTVHRLHIDIIDHPDQIDRDQERSELFTYVLLQSVMEEIPHHRIDKDDFHQPFQFHIRIEAVAIQQDLGIDQRQDRGQHKYGRDQVQKYIVAHILDHWPQKRQADQKAQIRIQIPELRDLIPAVKIGNKTRQVKCFPAREHFIHIICKRCQKQNGRDTADTPFPDHQDALILIQEQCSRDHQTQPERKTGKCRKQQAYIVRHRSHFAHGIRIRPFRIGKDHKINGKDP